MTKSLFVGSQYLREWLCLLNIISIRPLPAVQTEGVESNVALEEKKMQADLTTNGQHFLN